MPCKTRTPISASLTNQHVCALHDKDIVYRDHVDIVDTLRLELIIPLDVSWNLAAARPRERSWHPDLNASTFCSVYNENPQTHKDVLPRDPVERERLQRLVFLHRHRSGNGGADLHLSGGQQRYSGRVGSLCRAREERCHDDDCTGRRKESTG